jgi:hypothetical protein
MRTILRAFALVALLGCALQLPAATTADPVNSPKAKLIFDNWEKFTDIAVSGATAKIGSDLIFRELDRHLANLAKRYLAPGETLVVTMRDIDLAGAIEPWRGSDFGNVRFLRDTQPPRLAFDYQVLDASGKVTKEGSAKLTNLTFKYQSTNLDQDVTRYEKPLLTDWAADTLGPPAKKKK